ncbi:MAG: CvpA family protein [Gammaproteobacteria bacterium]|nr:CvpA family protein [Gammaproteobacteria bacterium]MYF10299.1 CvpA family protein [Gammaproteobacteria bacterium]MYH15145.1 CvpA family protein [Gammaproteobacteria bacterium]MYK82540.1 CvpA family protein [Gammaproteobacteria bacterium]
MAKAPSCTEWPWGPFSPKSGPAASPLTLRTSTGRRPSSWRLETRSRPIASLDIIVLVLVVASALIGLFRGLMREVLSLAIWVFAVLGTIALGPLVADWLTFGSEAAQAVAGYAIVFVAIILLGAMVQKLVAKALDATGLSGTDRVLGLVFGGARGLALCLVAFVVLRPFAEDAAWWQASLAPPLLAEFENELLEWVGGVDADASDLRMETL